MTVPRFKKIIFAVVITLLSACGGGISENSHPSQFAPQTAPTIDIKRNLNNQLMVDWSKQQNSQAYRLLISSSENFEPNQTSLINVPAPPFVVESLEIGLKYYAKVQSSWEDKVGPDSNSVEFVVPPSAPAELALDPQSFITWQTESPSINVYWSKNSVFLLPEAEGSALSVTEKPFQPDFSNYQPGDILYILTTANNEGIESAVSEKIQLTVPTVPTTPNKPSDFSATIVNKQILLSWENGTELDTYRLYRQTNSVFNEAIATQINNVTSPFIDDTALVEQTYYYWLVAINNNVASDRTKSVMTTLQDTPISTPLQPRIMVSDGAYSLDWETVTNANSYTTYVASEIGVTRNNTETLENGKINLNADKPFENSLTNGERLYLVVSAKKDSDEESIESTELTIKPKMSVDGVPEDISIKAAEDQLTISWKTVTNALSYNVYWSYQANVTASNGQLIPGGADLSSNTITHSGLENGLMHHYVVTAISDLGESEESAEVGAIPYGFLPEPKNLAIEEADKQFTLTWPDVPGANNYFLYMARDNSLTKDNIDTLEGSMKHIVNVTSPFVHPGLTNGLTYYIRLTAIDKFGKESIESEVIEATPQIQTIENLPPELNAPILDITSNEDDFFNFQFDNQTFTDPEGATLSYSARRVGENSLPNWLNFNAENRTFSGTPQNTDVGAVEIKIIATDDLDNSTTDKFSLKILNTNDSPTLTTPISPRSVIVGSTFNFQVPENTFTDIDINDELSISAGNLPEWLSFEPQSATFSGIPATADIGTNEIEIIANDGNNGTVSTQFPLTVVVPSLPPIAVNDGPVFVNENNNVFIDILGNDLTTSGPINPISVKIIKTPTQGDVTNIVDGRVLYTHNANSTLTSDSFTYTVEDEAGNTSNEATVNMSITFNNKPPVISGVPETNVNVGELYSFTPIASDPDNAQSELIFSINKLTSTWATFNPSTGKLSGTPSISDIGKTSNIIIGVSDGEIEIFLTAFELTVVDVSVAPTAINDGPLNVDEGKEIVINILKNDLPNGSTINTASVKITQNPLYGDITLNSDGTITYTSTSSENTTDSLIYTVENETRKVSNGATVTINIKLNNKPPSISGVPTMVIKVGELFDFTPVASDPDSSPNNLSFKLNTPLAWATFNTNTGNLSGIPAKTDVGTHSNIIISVSDGDLESFLPPFDLTVEENALPNKPTDLKSKATTKNIALTWSESANVSQYRIYFAAAELVPTRSDSSALVSSNAFADSRTLEKGSFYHYLVVSVNGNGESADGATTTNMLLPDQIAPTVTYGCLQAGTLSWDPLSDAISYDLFWTTSDNPQTTFDASTNVVQKIPNVQSPYYHNDASNPNFHYYVIRAINKNGESNLKNTPVKISAINPGLTCQDLLPNGLGFAPTMIVIPSGSFIMGDDTSFRTYEQPAHLVNIQDDFNLGETEITFTDYDLYLKNRTIPPPIENPSRIASGEAFDNDFGRDSRPAINITWDEAQIYLSWLNTQLNLSGKASAYRLPSESEWEYAARAGTETQYYFGDSVTHNDANYGAEICCDGLIVENTRDKFKNTSPAKSFSKNTFGVYDIFGNVHEWLQDCLNLLYAYPLDDPQFPGDLAPTDGTAWTQSGDCNRRSIRGGAWVNQPDGLRSANRNDKPTDRRKDNIGFRIARSIN